MIEVDFVYAAIVLRWVDGDTVDVLVDVGFRASRTERLRLRGIDTPERGQPGYTDATDAAHAHAPGGSDVVIRTYSDKAETFGRFVADIWTEDGLHINAALVNEGFAIKRTHW